MIDYLQVYLYENKNRNTYRVHRIVAKEFIDNPENRSYVDHIDHNKQNNCVNNLRWCSKSENGMNRNKQRKPCSSNFKGVSWHKHKHRWSA